jgi:hypothetical protein
MVMVEKVKRRGRKERAQVHNCIYGCEGGWGAATARRQWHGRSSEHGGQLGERRLTSLVHAPVALGERLATRPHESVRRCGRWTSTREWLRPGRYGPRSLLWAQWHVYSSLSLLFISFFLSSYFLNLFLLIFGLQFGFQILWWISYSSQR